MNILLIGFKSCGKSSAGAALARLRGQSFLDTDTIAEEIYRERFGVNRSCREIAVRHGQDALRDLETEALRQIVANCEREGVCTRTAHRPAYADAVIATGGGIAIRDENLPLLRRAGLCVFLDTPLPELEKRLAGQADSPLFKTRSVKEVYEERRPRYLEAADLRHVPVAGGSPEAVAAALWRELKSAGDFYKE